MPARFCKKNRAKSSFIEDSLPTKPNKLVVPKSESKVNWESKAKKLYVDHMESLGSVPMAHMTGSAL